MIKYFYIVYKTTNIINNKIYIGVHKTRDIDSDLYLGSGHKFLYALRKYGRDNFSREILFLYHSEKVAYTREKYIVNSVYLSKSNHYNLKLGGRGGFHGCYTREARSKVESTCIEKYGSICGQMNNIEITNKRKSLMINKYGSMTYHIHTDESKRKAALGRIESSLSNIPELSINCKLLKPDGDLEIEGTVYDISLHLYGYTLAVRNRFIILNQLKTGRGFISRKWKGYKIINS